VVPRWKAAVAVVGAWIAGAWGTGALALYGLAVIVLYAVVLEIDDRHRTLERAPTGPPRCHVRTLQEGDPR